MIAQSAATVEAKEIKKFPYKGKDYDVTGVTIRWLSKVGDSASGPDYGLRYFTVAPGGTIPIHNHFYVQTMYIIAGELIVYSYDGDTDEVAEEKRVEVGDSVFVASMEPHGMTNPSDSDEAAFLCCICNMYENR
ncbi:MAG: cupin domain-containing protein [Actinobacteria bacterium]|nr:cupin domain-containing protein [Actinomycetota bacterium]